MNYWLFRVKISGESMWPHLIPGKTYWASNLLTPKPGRIIVIEDKNSLNGFAVKSVKAQKNDQYELSGTVSWSHSYQVSRKDIIGTLF